MKKNFEPFERIIIKHKIDYGVWFCALFSYYENDGFFTIGGPMEGYSLSHVDVLPYAGNEHLVGTSDMPEECVELKADELCAMFYDEDDVRNCRADIRRFSYVNSFSIFDTGRVEYGYCVKFSQFNPNDMEETRKHILCVKNGKLIKAI